MITEEDLKEYRENGRKLFRSTENLRRSSDDLSALMDSLEEMLSKGKADIGEVEATDKKNKFDKTDWVARASLRNWKVKCETEEEPVGALTYIVRLCGAEDAIEQDLDRPWLDQACLIMGWHKCDDYEECDSFWSVGDFDSHNAKNLHHRGNGLWAWPWQYEDGEADEYYGGFFFALPIFALKDERDLMKFVLEPLKILFEAKHPHTVAAEALAGVPVLTPAAG